MSVYLCNESVRIVSDTKITIYLISMNQFVCNQFLNSAKNEVKTNPNIVEQGYGRKKISIIWPAINRNKQKT